MVTILKKELRYFFGTFNGYLISGAFVVIAALFLWFFDNEYNVFNLGNASLSSFFFLAPWLLLFIVPAMTMRQLAEEKQMGTLDWLFAQAVNKHEIVLGKYFAVLILILFMLSCTLIFVYTTAYFSMGDGIDLGTVFSGYLGLFLLAALFAALGMLVSTLAPNQVVAYVGSIIAGFILYYGFSGLASYNLLGQFDYFMQQIGSEFHYNGFVKGVIDTRDLLYFVLLIALVLWLAYFFILNKKPGASAEK
ncbi:MAG: ABC transporter permease subunit [Weeksellaceae bacterium]|nr:ABC transporter permease subunit [Weeksellaceae bacterium]